MKEWNERSKEEANILNPAFISIIISQCIKGYIKEKNENAPYVLPFLIVPFILHKQTRNEIPSKISIQLSTWIKKPEMAEIKISYPERVRSISPYIKEGLIFAMAHDIIKIEDSDKLSLDTKKIGISKKNEESLTDEVIDCYKKSEFCGRWFAKVGKIETLMTLLGVKP
ncbi:MAG: DUF6521 family protein [Methanomicrobium sp.]|nr:DUF6521 family protein [Methanomicrobium sp.]